MYVDRYLILRIALYVYKHCGRLLFKKNSGLKLLKFHVPNGTVQSGCTYQTQATARLVICGRAALRATILSNG